MSIHISIDLETLDTKPSALVLSCGLVAFDPEAGYIVDRRYVRFSQHALDAQMSIKRTMSPATVRWWAAQSDDARRVLTDDDLNVYHLLPGLECIRGLFQLHAPSLEGVWGNGSDFDNAILGSLFQDAGDRQPWSYGRNRCLRTLKNLSLPKTFIKPERVGTHHHALDDAEYQANYVMAIAKALNLKL